MIIREQAKEKIKFKIKRKIKLCRENCSRRMNIKTLRYLIRAREEIICLSQT